MASPASTSSSSVMRCAAPLRRDAPPRASSGTWTKAARRGPCLASTASIRAPAQIIAEVTPGIARGPGVDAGAAGRAQEFGGVRPEHRGVGAADDRSLARAVAIGVGEERGDGIARAGFDPDMRRAIGEAENQQRLRAMFGDQFGQFPVDRRVGHVEDVADQFDVGEGRAAQLRQPLHQRHRRVERRPGKGPEAGDEDAQFLAHVTSASPRSAPPPAPA